jgi:hypothetical protein
MVFPSYDAAIAALPPAVAFAGAVAKFVQLVPLFVE